jgi:hypothetical protein
MGKFYRTVNGRLLSTAKYSINNDMIEDREFSIRKPLYPNFYLDVRYNEEYKQINMAIESVVEIEDNYIIVREQCVQEFLNDEKVESFIKKFHDSVRLYKSQADASYFKALDKLVVDFK